jgi:hypothetical protein
MDDRYSLGEGLFMLALFIVAGLAIAGVILGEWRWLMGDVEF